MTTTAEPTTPAPIDDRVIWRPDLERLLARESDTVRRYIKSGKVPAPDVNLSRKTQGWRLSTLRAAGLI